MYCARVDLAGDIAAAVVRDRLGMLGISVAIVALFATGEALRRVLGVATEYTRKLAHVGGGVVVMSLPWALSSHWTVLLLSLAFFGLLAIGRVTGLLGSVHAVERTTGGAYFYPFAVYGSYLLARGDPLLFCVPIGVMAVADTGAAIVGKRMGNTRYRVMDGARSLEGSFTFFALAFALILGGVALDGRGGWPGVLLVALVGGIVTTCVEAVSVRGADNLFIPYAGFLVLDRTLRLGLAEMGAWIEGMLIGFVAVVLAWKPARLQPAGAVAAFLFATLAWALGGPGWLLPLATLSALLVLVRAPDEDWDLEQVFPTLIGSSMVLLAFGHSGRETWYLPFLVTVAANGAIAMALIGRAWRPDATGWRRGWIAPIALVGAVAPALAAWTWDRDVPVDIVALGGMAGLALYFALHRAPVPGRRLAAAALSGLAVWALTGGA